MKNKQMMTACLLTGAALLFTLLIKVVDVQAVGPNGSAVGFAAINDAVRKGLGTSLGWYKISKILGYVAILTGGLFACLGLWQLVQRKSLKKVDKVFFVLAALYVLLVIFWKGFDKIALNYRPILENGVLEPSYPSTHSLLGLVFFGSAVPMIVNYVKPGMVQKLLVGLACLGALLTVLARFLSGVHWLTDIVGGILIAAAMLAWFWYFVKKYHP